MDDLALKLIPAKSAADAVPGFFATVGEGAPLPWPDRSPMAYLAELTEAGHFIDAASFLATALPRREGVWWGCRCIRSMLNASLSGDAEAALVAAETWTVAPGDINRRKAMPAAEAIGFGHPAGSVALAAFLSGGSLAPPHLQEVPPPEHAFPRALAGAIQLAAARAEPGRGPEAFRQFLALGLAVARGEDRWKNPT